MSGKARPARFRAAEALKRILDEGNETDTSLSSEVDSGSDYEDHVSQVSEQSDVECADVTTTTQQPPPVNMQSSADGTAVSPTATNRGRGRGRVEDVVVQRPQMVMSVVLQCHLLMLC